MFHSLGQRLLGIFIPAFHDYDHGYRLYETFAEKHGIGMEQLTPQQFEAARDNPGLREAKLHYDKALALCRAQGQQVNAAIVGYQIGLLYRLWRQPEQAIAQFQETLRMFESSPPKRDSLGGVALCHFYLGDTLITVGSVADGLRHLEVAVAAFQLAGKRQQEERARALLKKLWEPAFPADSISPPSSQ